MIYKNKAAEEIIMNRCKWCLCNEKMIRYHDEEWGVPLRDDRKQFEFLMMEVMQCGLNWNMMIQKREIFRQCFENFDYDKVAEYGEADIERILNTEGMIRSRRKIEGVIHNARCFQEIRREWGSFSRYIWSFTKEKTYLYTGHQKGELPARNGLSDRISQDLKKRGMKYMGSVRSFWKYQTRSEREERKNSKEKIKKTERGDRDGNTRYGKQRLPGNRQAYEGTP